MYTQFLCPCYPLYKNALTCIHTIDKFYSISKSAPWNDAPANHWEGALEHSKHSASDEKTIPAGNRLPTALLVIHHYINSALRKILNSQHKIKCEGLRQWCTPKRTNLFDITNYSKHEGGHLMEYPKYLFQLNVRKMDDIQQVYMKTKF